MKKHELRNLVKQLVKEVMSEGSHYGEDVYYDPKHPYENRKGLTFKLYDPYTNEQIPIERSIWDICSECGTGESGYDPDVFQFEGERETFCPKCLRAEAKRLRYIIKDLEDDSIEYPDDP